LVDQDDVAADARSYTEPEPREHAGGIRADGLVEPRSQFGELLDIRQQPRQFAARKTYDRADEPNVFSTRQLLMQTASDLDHGKHPSADLDLTPCRRGHAGKD